MRTSLNPLMYKEWELYKLYTEPGEYTLNLSPGTYQYIMRGAGGAGGNNDSSNNRKGGAGGKGELSVGTFAIEESTFAAIYVGEMGFTYANGGNGGPKGDGTNAPVNPGVGGGGGKPSYILIDGAYYVANGGGGGGGAGGSDTLSSRYSDGASGGGGGGYYRFMDVPTRSTRTISFWINGSSGSISTSQTGAVSTFGNLEIPLGSIIKVGNIYTSTVNGIEYKVTVTSVNQNGTVNFSGSITQDGTTTQKGAALATNVLEYSVGNIESVPGKKGGRGAINADHGSKAAQAGTTGNTQDFPDIVSGKGGNGNDNTGLANGAQNASGGGASGAGAGCGTGNSSASRGGGGGGGAGGSTDAGGGQGGTGNQNGSDASNQHTYRTDTVYENTSFGFAGNYGMGGGTATNGNSGFVYIRLLKTRVSTWDLGQITEEVTEIEDMGAVDSAVSNTLNMGILQKIL